MNIYKNIQTILLVPCMFIACSRDLASPDFKSTTEIYFDISRSNSDNDYSSKVSDFSFKKSYHSWNLGTDGTIDIYKENTYDIILSNGETLDFGIWFSKLDEDTIYIDFSPDKNWSYKNTEFEKKRFFQDFDEARILIGNNVIFHSTQNDSFEISQVKMVSDKELKNYITIKFKGKATGFYDPEGKYSPFYTIENGTFRGVLE